MTRQRSSHRSGEGPSAATFVRSFGVGNFIVFLGLSLAVLILSCDGERGRAGESTPEARTADAERRIPGRDEPAGELFGVPVPMDNYRFCYAVTKIFGHNPAGEKDEQERVWNELILSYEAVVRRKIEPPREEIEKEISDTIKASKAEFDRKKDRAAYEEWAGKKMGVPAEAFENMIAHMVRVRTLRQQILDEQKVSVSDEEAFEEFLREHHTLSLEVVEFEDEAKAKDFYRKAKADEKFWDREKTADEKKEKKDRRFKMPGKVSLEWLIFMWKFPEKALFEMVEQEAGSLYPPAPIYEGYGVFRILEVRRAKREDFPKCRKSYISQVTQRKKFEGFKKWLKELKEEAKMVRAAEFPPAAPSS